MKNSPINTILFRKNEIPIKNGSGFIVLRMHNLPSGAYVYEGILALQVWMESINIT